MQKILQTLVFTLLLTLMSIPSLLQAQSGSAIIRGFVYEKESGEPMIFTNVFLEGTTYGAATDINGFFSINKVPEGTYTLMSTGIGYDTSKVEIVVKPNQILNEKLFVSKSDILLDVFEVGAAKQEAQTEVRTSVIKITPKQITKIPAIGGEPDLAQYLQVLPGVVFTGDQGGQLYIRGGSQIQTRVLLDGITIYNPFHSIGLFSVFETDLIRNVEVMTGGFNAEYSGRISAVIDVTTKDGNKNRHTGKIAANTFLSKAILEGPLMKLKEGGVGVSASYILSLKSSYLDKTSKTFYSYIDTAGLPYTFTDLYGKVSFNTDNGSKFNLSGFRFGDDAKFAGQSDFSWDATGVGSTFVLIPGQSKMILDGFLSVSDYNLSLEEGTGNPRQSSIGGFNGGINFNYFLPNSSDITYGIEVSGYSTTFEFINPLGFKIEENQNTTEIGGYLKYKANINDKLVVEPSVRINYYASAAQFKFEPRFGLKYNASEDVRFKLAGGVYTQNFISTKSDRDVVNLFTGFLSAPETAIFDTEGNRASDNLQSATHAIAGVEFDLTSSLSLNVEGYYKNFGQLTNVNRNKLFGSDPNYIIETGTATGVDLLLKYDYKNLFVWLVYSLSEVDRDDGTQIYNPHFDRRHNLNFLSSYNFGKNTDWEVSVRWNYGSGFPFTQTQGFYENLNFLDSGIDVDLTTENGNLGIIFDEQLNGGRLPDYHRLDLSLKKKFAIGANSILELSGSVTNVYDRPNIFYFDRVRYDRINQLPILPSFGGSFTF